MAQYYNGRYGSDYGNREYNPQVISMYNPEEMSVLAESARGKQGRFDAGVAGAAQEIARIGDLDTFNSDLMTSRLNDFEGKINDTVARYDGDYSAAANDIVSLIGKERNDPFYKFNEQKVEAVKMHQEDKRRLGANFMSAKDPMSIDYDQWKEGENFEYTPVDKNQIVQASAAIFGQMANTMMSDSGLMRTPEGQYFKSIVQYGFKDGQEAQEFLGTQVGQRMVNELKQSMPELEGLDDTAVMSAIAQGAYAGIGQTKVDHMQNKNFEYERDARDQEAEYNLVPGGFMREAGYMNAQLGDDKQMQSEELVASFKEGALTNILKTDEYKELLNEYDITSMSDLRKEISKSNKVIQTPMPEEGYTNPEGVFVGAVGRDKPQDVKLLRLEKEINSIVQEAFSKDILDDPDKAAKYGIMSYEMDDLYEVDATEINKYNTKKTQLNGLIDGLVTMENQNITPLGGKNERALKSIVGEKELDRIALHPVTRQLIITVTGEDKGGKRVESQTLLKDSSEESIYQILLYINKISPGSAVANAMTEWYYDFENNNK